MLYCFPLLFSIAQFFKTYIRTKKNLEYCCSFENDCEEIPCNLNQRMNNLPPVLASISAVFEVNTFKACCT